MDDKLKKLLGTIAVILFIGVALFWFLGSDIEHIEDTNGPDDYSLTTITDENIIKMDIGALGNKRSEGFLSGDLVEFSSKKFTGVVEIMHNNYIGKSDVYFELLNYNITEGNFKIVVVHDDKIVAELEPDLFVDFHLENISGTVSLRIAGESAAYSFGISSQDYERFAHD